VTNDDPTTGIPKSCAVFDPSLRVPASVPGVGDRTCYDPASTTPEQACADLCSASPLQLSDVLWPLGAEGCSASVRPERVIDIDPPPNAFSTCGNGAEGPLANAGSVAVTLDGPATVQLGAASQEVPITSGYADVDAPDTSCTGQSVACVTQLNQLAVVLGDASVGGRAIGGLSFVLAANSQPGPGGTFDPMSGRFVFPEVPGSFDAAATIDGSSSALSLSLTQLENGTFDPRSGDFSIQFSLVGEVGGQTFQTSGLATASKVVDVAPLITAPVALTVDANNGCSATVAVAASASSPTGLPVTLRYVVDGKLAGDGTSPLVTLSAGSHQVTVVGFDSDGQRGKATEVITVSAGPGTTCP
jgi:hypothetical protein